MNWFEVSGPWCVEEFSLPLTPYHIPHTTYHIPHTKTGLRSVVRGRINGSG